MTPRKGTAPCGHEGTFATNSFVTCDLRCGMPSAVPEPVDDWITVSEDDIESDGVPLYVDPDRTLPNCGSCGSVDTVIWPSQWSRGALDYYYCNACGKSFYA